MDVLSLLNQNPTIPECIRSFVRGSISSLSSETLKMKSNTYLDTGFLYHGLFTVVYFRLATKLYGRLPYRAIFFKLNIERDLRVNLNHLQTLFSWTVFAGMRAENSMEFYSITIPLFLNYTVNSDSLIPEHEDLLRFIKTCLILLIICCIVEACKDGVPDWTVWQMDFFYISSYFLLRPLQDMLRITIYINSRGVKAQNIFFNYFQQTH